MEHQTRVPERLIIVDNASTDSSESVMENRPNWMQLIPLEVNTGFARGNNIALSYLLTYDYIALLNPDTLPDKDWLKNLLAATQRHKTIDCYGSKMLEMDPKSVDGTGDSYHVNGLYWRRDNGLKVGSAANTESEIFSACAAASLYPRKSLTDLLGFDEDYFCYSEDIDLGFRLRNRGSKFWYIPDAIVQHAGSGTTGRHSDFSIYYGHRNLVWTYVQNMPGKYFWMYLPQHLLLNIVSIIVFCIRGQSRVILKAKWDALCGLRSAFSKRKLNQYMRLVSSKELIRTMKKGWISPYLNRHE